MKENKRPRRPAALRMTALAAALGVVLAGGSAWTPAARAAEEVRQVIPMGRAVGIKLFADGVMVVGLADVETGRGSESPARDCGLKEGDVITRINATPVNSIEQVQTVLRDLDGDAMRITAVRGEEELSLSTRAVQCSSDGAYKLGAWIRDSMAGIGTMTFYDPESGVFGALGHGINDVDTAQLMPLQTGAIMYAEVSGVQRGEVGAPGELHGRFKTARELGELSANTASGVFGRLSETSMASAAPVEVARRDQVKTGRAVIRSNIAGDEVREYEVEITHVAKSGSDGRDLTLRVTDPELLSATGGIVQGMSGSPILQGGRLVGAVTHVLVNDPTGGYGILAENMLAAAGAE